MPPRRERTVAPENLEIVRTNSFDDVDNRIPQTQSCDVSGNEGLLHQFGVAVPFHEQFERYVIPTQPGIGRVRNFFPSGARNAEPDRMNASSVEPEHTGRTVLPTDATFDTRGRQIGSKIRTSNAQRANLANSTFHDALPPGFPVPPPSEPKTGEIKRVPAKVQGKRVARPRPVKTPPGIRVFRQRPASRASRTKSGTENDDTSPGSERSESFQIKDAEKVRLYLKEKLILLQQQALKKIAKVWIKAICFKKQARFPYSSTKHQVGEPGDVPPWWPSPALCPHIEPDHIKAPERVNLLIHLLRLRPSPQDLQDWNGITAGQNTAHAFQTDGEWTEFLRQLTPLSLLDDVVREPQKKVDRRPLLLKEIFQVAKLEEEYGQGGNDGIDTIAWTPDPDACLKDAKKRLARHSVIADEDGEASPFETSSQGSQPRAKKAKTNPGYKRPRRSKSMKAKSKAVDQSIPAPSKVEGSSSHAYAVPFPQVHHITPSDDANQKPSVYTDSSLNTSFNSTDSTFDEFDNPWYEAAPFLGTAPNFGYDEYQTYQRPVEVHSVYDVAQPRFQSTSGLPIVRPMDLALHPNTYTAMCPQINQQRIDQGESLLPYGNSRPSHSSEHQLTFSGHNRHAQMVANEHEHDAHFGLKSHQQTSYGPLGEHQEVYFSHPYEANMHAPVGTAFEHADDARWRHPYGGLPMPQQEHAPFDYGTSQILPESVHHGFTGPGSGTGGSNLT